MKRGMGQGAAGRPTPPPQAAANQAQKLTTNDALSYLREVKNRFQDRKQVYDTFLDIMKEFKAQRIDTSGVIVRVKQLFKGHRELILGFNTFLPKGYEIELAQISDDEEEEPAPKQAVEFDQAINYVNKIKQRFANDERVYKAFLEILNMYRKGQKNITMVYQEVAGLFQHHDDLLHEFTYFLPDTSQQGTNMSQQMRQMIGRGGGMQPGMGGMRMGGMAMGGRGMGRGMAPGMPYGGMGGYMGMPGMMGPVDHSRMQHKRKAARRAEEGFRRMDDDESAYGVMARGGRGSLAREMQFLEKVKTRLRSRELYADFLKCLNMYSQEIIGRAELSHLVADILGRTPDLMAQFHHFMSSCESLDMAELHAGAQGMGPGGRGAPGLSNRDLLKAKLQKDKFMTKPLSELVANETERITPSYVAMPPGYPRLTHTGRTPLGNEVLNDVFVNVITGSEDYSFKLMRKNQYEEALFRCEDDRYEFDIACEQNKSAIRKFRPIAERLMAMSPEEKAGFSWADVQGVNAVHMAHISKLYAESGPQILDLLQKNPAVAIPVILTRLEAKDAEWRKVRDEMIGVWRKIYEQNYPRSLDHRSFYFKQAEKKQMMAKFLVGEVKEVADRRKAGDDAQLRALSMAHKHALPAAAAQPPDMVLNYADRSVFEDVYVALSCGMDYQLHAGTKEQVLLLLIQVIEPFMGLPVRTEELAALKQQMADEGGEAKEEGDVEMAPDIKSDSSDQAGEGAAAGRSGGEEVGSGSKGADGTPEPGDDKEKTEGEGEQEVGRRKSADEEDALADEEPTHEHRSSFAQCKPLVPWCGPQPPAQPESGTPQGEGVRVMFGNESMYLFFRYHRILYERLCLARKICLEVATKKATQPQRGGGPLGVPLTLMGDSDSRPPTEPPSEAAIKEDADRIHAQFMTCVREMLAAAPAQSDIGAFEDQVRNLLGTNSYELFTLDKLAARIIKHMAGMVSDSHTAALWDMYAYEGARSAACPRTLYHVNVHTVLDDTCYRIEFSDSDHSLRFQQNDSERSDAYLAPEGALPAYIAHYINATGPAPGQQPKHEVDEDEEEEEEQPSVLFLRRNLAPSIAASPEQALVTALTQFVVDNRLETKIGCTSHKMSYVLDTEDVMVKRKRRCTDETRRQARNEVKNTKMVNWCEARMEAMRLQAERAAEEAGAAARLLAQAASHA